jgi:hypothetical protein
MYTYLVKGNELSSNWAISPSHGPAQRKRQKPGTTNFFISFPLFVNYVSLSLLLCYFLVCFFPSSFFVPLFFLSSLFLFLCYFLTLHVSLGFFLFPFHSSCSVPLTLSPSFPPPPHERVGHVIPRRVLGAVIVTQHSVKISWTLSAGTVMFNSGNRDKLSGAHAPNCDTLLQVLSSHPHL